MGNLKPKAEQQSSLYVIIDNSQSPASPAPVVTMSEMMEVPQIRKIQNTLPQKIDTDKSELYNLLAQRGNIDLIEDERVEARQFANQAVASLLAQEGINMEALSKQPLQDQIKIFRDLQANHFKAVDMSKRLMKSSQIEYERFKDPLNALSYISSHS